MSGHKDLKVFQMAYRLALEIFRLMKTFPPEERYSLTDQIRRSSRSVAVNITEGLSQKTISKCFRQQTFRFGRRSDGTTSLVGIFQRLRLFVARNLSKIIERI